MLTAPAWRTALRALLVGAWLAVPAWLFATRWGTLWAGHPLLPTLLVAALAVSSVLLTGAVAGRPRRIWTLVVAVVVSALLLGMLGWLRPSSATAPAVAAVRGSEAVRVSQDATTITLTPAGRAASGVGFVFQPGARVDARAYVALLGEVAARGHVVVIVKQPLGIAFTATGAAPRVFAVHPGVTRWAVGGHSLGGVVAARSASGDPRIAGLVLWASYPDGATTVRGLPVLSVAGSADGLATPAQIAAGRPLLPPDTRYVWIEGGIHAYFGDYGAQPGDGVPGVDRATAQREIIEATAGFLDRLR